MPEDPTHNCSRPGAVGEWQHSYISDNGGRSYRIAKDSRGKPFEYGQSTAEGAIVPLPGKPDHVMAVMRTDLGDQLQSDGRLPVASRCVGPQPATGTSGNVTACRTVAFSTNGGATYGETKQLAALPDSGCKGSLAEWPAGGAIIASSPDNGGCRAGCKEFCDWHGTGRAISKAWQQICDSGVCCPGGLDSASGGVRAIHSLAHCAFHSLADAESLRPPSGAPGLQAAAT